MSTVAQASDIRGRTGPAARWPVAAVIGATIACLLLGAWQLGDKSLWYDEGASVGLVDRPYGDFLWRLVHWEVNQSPYFLLLSGWERLGDGEAFLRIPSVVFAAASVPATFALGRRLFDDRIGAVAAVLLAVHPFVLEWGQQVRGYSLVLLLAVLASLAFVRALDRRTTADAVLYAVTAALAVYGHFFAAFVVLAHALSLLALPSVPRRLVTTAGTTLAVLVAPLAWFFVTREGDPLFWVGDDSDGPLLDALRTGQRLAGGSGAAAVAYAIAAGLGLWHVGTTARAEGRSARTWPGALVSGWLLVPPALVVLSTYTVKPLLEARFLIVVLPALVLLAAVGVCSLADRRVGLLGAAALVVASSFGIRTWYDTGSYEDWRGATRALVDAATPGDSLVIVPSRGVHVVRYYVEQHGGGPEAILPAAGDPPAGPRLFVLHREDGGTRGSPLETFPAWLEQHYVLEAEHPFERVVLRTYARR